MSNVQFTLVGYEGMQTIVVVIDGQMHTAADSHPSFDAIVAGAVAGDASIVDLFDVAQTIANTVEDEQLSERLRASHGRITFDGDPLDASLESTILRYLSEGDRARLAPLVSFVEKVMTNPEPHSRDQAYGWLAKQSFALTDEGNVLGYKGVYSDGDGNYRSTHSGSAIVNGEAVKGQIPQTIGDVVEMPRSAVTHDPSNACASGLHIGTMEYAKGYGNAQILVEFNPRDIVSVPSGEAYKLRVSRYTVVDDVTDEDTLRPMLASAEQVPTCVYCGKTAAQGCEYVVAD